VAGVSTTTRRVQCTVAPWLDAYLRWLEAHPPLTFDGREYDLFSEGFQAAIAAIDDIALTPEERDLILLVRAEQTKRDAQPPNEDMDESADVPSAARAVLQAASASVALGERQDQGEYVLVPLFAIEALSDALAEPPLPRDEATTR
jgi:hypothetical protein